MPGPSMLFRGSTVLLFGDGSYEDISLYLHEYMYIGKGKQCSLWSHRRLHFTTGQSRVCTDYNLTNGDSCVLKEVHLNLVSTTKLHVDSKLSAAKIMTPGNSGEKSC